MKHLRSSWFNLSFCCSVYGLIGLTVCEVIVVITALDDGDTHTHQPGTPFPKVFVPTCKKILTRLYRVFVHVYIHHFEQMVATGAVSTHKLI